MASYTIRQGFTIILDGIIYAGGDTVELSQSVFEQHRHKLEGTISSVKPIIFDGETASISRWGESVYLDSELNMRLSTQKYFEGAAFNVPDQSEFAFRQYHGIKIQNTNGIVFTTPALITNLEIFCGATTLGSTVEIQHYGLNGNDKQLLAIVAIDKQQNTMGFLNSSKIFVPAFRNLCFFVNGRIHYSRMRLAYRKIFEG